MIPKKIVEYEVDIAVKENEGFKCDILWADFMNASKAFLPEDRIIRFYWKERTGVPAFSMGDEEKTYYTFIVVVARTREETDEEYFNRIKAEEQYKVEVEKRERLEYLRLKAKFEG